MRVIDRRALLQSLAVLPFLAPGIVHAQDLGRIARAPIRLRDDRLWMPVRFGAEEAHDFILDTGSFANLIREPLARSLDLRPMGSLRSMGVGGAARMPAFRAPDVSLGDVRVGSMVFAAYGPELSIHPRAGGALSAGLMTAADSDLDFDSGQWRIHLDGRSDRTGFEALPSSIRSDGPGAGAGKLHVDAEMDGRIYRLAVDTGAPGDLVLSPAGTRKSGLWNDTVPFSPHRRFGIGGDGGAARRVRGGPLRIGGISFDRPLVSLTDPGERRTMDADGLLGIGLIERMNLSTDVRARRLWARRNNRPARPERYGISGLWLAEQGGGVVVEVVGTGSPAADAGLRTGDRLQGGSLAEWIDRLGGRPGEAIEIPFVRDGAGGTARITLREYL